MSYKYFSALLSHLLLLIPASANNPVPTPADKAIFILAGQSNMAGRGGVTNNIWDKLTPPLTLPKQTILRLDQHLHWHVAKEPLHRGIDTNHTCGVGPGMAFANTVVDRVKSLKVVGLVPCAEGGTNIGMWSRGSRLYSQLVKRAEWSLREGGSIEGLVWYQGESDTVVKVDADMYREKLERFFLDVRTDLQSPLLPILQVAIASGEGPYINEVREAQMGVDLLNLKTVDAKGLPLEPDNLHLTTSAQVQLGLKLAEAFLEFLPKQVQTSPDNMLLQTNTANFLYIFFSYTSIIVAFLLIFV